MGIQIIPGISNPQILLADGFYNKKKLFNELNLNYRLD